MGRKCVWVFAGLIGLALSANAQEAGQIVGVVRDTTGGAVAGVVVKATESGTGFATSVVTGSEGQYVLPSLRPTTYLVTAEFRGQHRPISFFRPKPFPGQRDVICKMLPRRVVC